MDKDIFLNKHSIINHFKQADIRIVFRPTNFYAMLMIDSYYPLYLYHRKEQRKFINSRLYQNSNKAIRTHAKELIQAEYSDLNENNIPFFQIIQFPQQL